MKSLSIPGQFEQIFQAINNEKCIANFVKKIQNKDEKQKIQYYMLQYYSFKAAKQQKCRELWYICIDIGDLDY
jgi:hypothetical protein